MACEVLDNEQGISFGGSFERQGDGSLSLGEQVKAASPPAIDLSGSDVVRLYR
jgi:hypothetical protein